MAQPPTTRLPCNEADILLAILALEQRRISSVNLAAAVYNVPQSTLADRLAGRPARRNCKPNLKKLTKLKEEVVIKHILDLNSRGFSPSLNAVREIADKLLATRSAEKVGI